MRHDYGDMFQVRYAHPNGESYDTWVSGEEVSHRLRSMAAEERLRAVRRLDFQALRDARDRLESQGRRKARKMFRDQVGDAFEEFIGGNVIGDGLVDAVRGAADTAPEDEDRRWKSQLGDAEFKALVIELAWRQLEGSFPEEEAEPDPGDWEPYE